MTETTKRKYNEEQYLLLASIVDSAEDAIFAEDRDGKILSWNGGAEKLFGYTAAEAVGHSISRPCFPREQGEHQSSVMTKQGEIQYLTKSGQPLQLSLTVSPIKDGSGQVVGSSTIARKITAKDWSEMEYRASELRYRRLFQAARDGILILDADSGAIVDVNPFLFELLGYPREWFIGRFLWEIGVFKDKEASQLAFDRLKKEGYIRYENLPLETRAGIEHQVEFVSNVYQEGAGCVIQCNIRDITERKLAEEVLKQKNLDLKLAHERLKTKTEELASLTQQLWQESKLTTMGELAASIAHELNNPLAIISLRLESIASSFADDTNQSHGFKIITGEVDRMASLVSKLLQFSRHTVPIVSPLDIQKEIEGTLDLILFHLRGHGVNVITDFQEGLPTVAGDPQQMRQIFLNLLTNASDAMPAGGILKVQVSSKTTENGQEGVLIEFIDSGTGIDLDNLEKIWEPFFTTKAAGKGTGLGLAISRRAIESHSGTIGVTSKLKEGTTVTIFLPIMNAHKHAMSEGLIHDGNE